MDTLIRTALDADGVLVATIDMPGRTMNVFSVDLMDALDALMDRVDADPAVHSCVVTSGKPSFLAGADLLMVRGYCDAAATSTPEQMTTMCGRLGRQFVRLENSAKPWVAAVNGLALGGGLELALACRVRIVADDPKLQLGVPEVRWGLLPGAGGTQRLPRLANVEAALDMLLSGRSIDPATAVRLGVFARAVPAAAVLDEARAAARTLHGRPYDVNSKYRNLAQTDVPAYSEATARATAERHGVTAETFDLYPAYGAIVDSVLKGAHLALAAATAVEMTQFLRLMFSPVAGRMVRTLFLERLRAERELAAPEGARLERIVTSPISAARAAWSEALAKVRLPQSADPALPADTLELIDGRGLRHRVALQVIGDPDRPTTDVRAVLAPAGPYGRVIEIVGADDAAAAALAALAARLWSLPWRTPGPQGVLARLHGTALERQAEIAAACAAQDGAGDPAFLDVAACLAGVTPAWSGGPLMWGRTRAERSRLDRLGLHGTAAMKRLVDALHPGARVWVPTLAAESALLQDELRADPERARGVTFSGAQFPGIDRIDYLALHPQARQRAYFMTPGVRAGLAQGRAELLSLDYLGIARHLLDEPPPDVAIAQLTTPDPQGWCSAGVCADFLPLVWTRARRRVAHLNPRLPRTNGSFRVHVSELDIGIEADLPLLDYAEARSGEIESRIGTHIAPLVRDGDTLQFGIGAVPAALATALTAHRRLRFHGGMLSSALRTLWDAGALDRDARIITGVVLGDAGLRDFVARLAPLWVTDVTQTHGTPALAAIPRLIAINSAIEVDLFGQVNSERVGGAIQAGAGGLPAFAQGALASPGGRLLICLPATARRGTVSRIVPALDARALCTLPRALTDAVVTEHGVAELRGLSLDARAQALIAIAAPEHRAGLASAWDEIQRNA